MMTSLFCCEPYATFVKACAARCGSYMTSNGRSEEAQRLLQELHAGYAESQRQERQGKARRKARKGKEGKARKGKEGQELPKHLRLRCAQLGV